MATDSKEDQLLYILADRVEGKSYHFYTSYDKRFAYCLIKNTATHPKDVLLLDLMDVVDGWKPSVDYDVINAASVYRQLSRCKGNFIILCGNLVGISNNSELSIFWTKGVLAESKLFTLTRKNPRDSAGDEKSVEWDHNKQLDCYYNSLSREWKDPFLDSQKKEALAGIKMSSQYEIVTKTSPNLTHALAHESVTSSLLRLERIFFDYAYHKHLAGEMAESLKAMLKQF